MRFRKKPVEIEAVQIRATTFNGADFASPAFSENPGWLDKALIEEVISPKPVDGHIGSMWNIKTLEGVMTAGPGDWVIRGVEGELYFCKDSIFQKTYEVACDHKGLDNQAVHWNPFNGIWQCHACGQSFAPIPEFTTPVLRPEERI
jgi:hypothetical protein